MTAKYADWIKELDRRERDMLIHGARSLADEYRQWKEAMMEADALREQVGSLESQLQAAHSFHKVAISERDMERNQVAQRDARIASLMAELDAAYAEISKQWPAMTAVFDRDVFVRVRRWQERQPGSFCNGEGA